MFYSMTGYGTGQATSKKMEVLCEIKSVNNRFIDISFKGYSLPNDLEEYIKNQIKKKFLRGSFEVKIFDNFQSDHSYELNEEGIRNLNKTLKSSKDFKHLNLKYSAKSNTHPACNQTYTSLNPFKHTPLTLILCSNLTSSKCSKSKQ